MGDRADTIEIIIEPRTAQVEGLSVRRILPFRKRRMVGPFCFLDHMGPAVFPVGKGVDVLAHPHIGLATVTYLFDGKMTHRDSLGIVQDIAPGDLNWMTAGRGIVHSERTPPEVRAAESSLHGLQLWCGLPEDREEMEPTFQHTGAKDLPRWKDGDTEFRLIAGEAMGRVAPVKVESPLFYLIGEAPRGAQTGFDAKGLECAVYVIQGSIEVNDQPVDETKMVVLKDNAPCEIVTTGNDTRYAIIGGEPIGARKMYWNFVSSRPERIEAAKQLWKAQGFPEIPGETGFVPLPD